jgi:hypothetical protein
VNHPNLILVGIALGVAVLILAFFTNPDRAAHLKAMKETVALRKSDSASAAMKLLLPDLKYKNYFVFSTTNYGTKIFTYGYFGRIRTTYAMEFLYRRIIISGLGSESRTHKPAKFRFEEL